MAGRRSLIQTERIESRIVVFRGHKVMLDADLAELYGVETKALNRAVRRNADRFPEDFMFPLTAEEFDKLRSHFGTSSLKSQIGTSRWGGRRYLPLAFTEQGVAMLSSVLHSKRAVKVNVEIMRAFVRLRQAVAAHRELAAKLAELEGRIGTHDGAIREIMAAIRQLMEPPEEPPKGRIGFHGK